MGLRGKQLHENVVINEGKLRTYITFKSIFKKKHFLNAIKNRDIRKKPSLNFLSALMI